MADLNLNFALKDLGELSYFLGLEAHSNDKGMILCQAKYEHDLLIKTNMQDVNQFATPVAIGLKLFPEDSKLFEEPAVYKNTIGALQFMLMNRLELSFVVNRLSQFLKALTKLQWQA